MTDAFDWTWASGSTPTLMTGPSADHTGGNKKYLLYVIQKGGRTRPTKGLLTLSWKTSFSEVKHGFVCFYRWSLSIY